VADKIQKQPERNVQYYINIKNVYYGNIFRHRSCWSCY